jgi:hemerythrin superfamily protein
MNPFKHLRTYVVTSLNPGDVRNHLQADHDRFLDAMDALSIERNSDRRASKAATLRLALVIHARAEEAVVYRALSGVKSSPASKAFADDGCIEHEVIEGLLDKLMRTRASTDEWKARVRVFSELLRHHFREEESEMFALLGANFDTERLESMGAQFLETRDKLVMLEEAKAA